MQHEKNVTSSKAGKAGKRRAGVFVIERLGHETRREGESRLVQACGVSGATNSAWRMKNKSKVHEATVWVSDGQQPLATLARTKDAYQLSWPKRTRVMAVCMEP